jgi:Pilus biogenesis CpaD protein (pilus_cpaD)
MVSKMSKFLEAANTQIGRAFVVTTICLSLAGCMGANDPLGDGGMAYTTDEMYPIAARKPCGQTWIDLGNDPSNHLSPNHGCAVHWNIAAMVADPTVLTRPKVADPTPASTAVQAITTYEANAATSTKTTNGTTYTVTQSP